MTLDDPVADLANALTEAHEKVQPMVDGLGSTEEARSVEFVLSAYDLAVEMWFQKGDPAAPTLTNWERPWRKYGGDNPTTTYLSAPVSPAHCYRLRGSIGDAVYAGVQLYTKGPGYNAPSGNISDRDLVLDDGSVDLLIGGERPGDGRAWLPLIDDDYLVMVRLYHRTPEVEPPSFTIERIDDHPAARLTVAARAHTAAAFFRDEVLSTMAVTDTLRDAGVNAYPPPDAPVHRPRYTGALFPTLDNVYDGFYVDLAPGAALRLRGRPRSPATARSCSTTAGSTLRTSRHTVATGPSTRSSSHQMAPTSWSSAPTPRATPTGSTPEDCPKGSSPSAASCPRSASSLTSRSSATTGWSKWTAPGSEHARARDHDDPVRRRP